MIEKQPDRVIRNIHKKSTNPFESAGYDIVQIRFRIENMIKSFSSEDRKDPNYKQLIKDIRSEVDKALDPLSRIEHRITNKWDYIYEFVSKVIKNPVFLAILCVILGALLGNIELLKTILSFFKG